MDQSRAFPLIPGGHIFFSGISISTPLSNSSTFASFFFARYTLFIYITDKAVKDAIKSGKKAPEPINEALENLEHHVDVPLIKPTQTVFSSMGGGRNASSTEIGWGGPEGGKPKDDTPKNFVYRDEDFPPPTTASDS